MIREQLLEKFDTETGWSTINPIEVLHIARKEFISLVVEMEELIAKDKLEYKRGWKDRATQSDLENKTCDGCKHFEDGICYSNKISLMNGGEYILTTKEFSCNKWEQK